MSTSQTASAPLDPDDVAQSIWWQGWADSGGGPDRPGTRERILQAAFREVHLNGFQAASIQAIIDAAGVTKGALYHYFSSKNEIGYALLDELFTRYVENSWVRILDETDDPISALIDWLATTGEAMTEQDIALGCPLDHFAQEMAPIDDGFQARIEALYKRKNAAMVNALKRGQEAGSVVRDIEAESIAMMIDASMQGCMAMAKHSRSLDTLMTCGAGLIHYLEQLRPVTAGSSAAARSAPGRPDPTLLIESGDSQ